ncbi:hypothetical protein JCM17960_27120 [Magnetospira thiophila]
MKPSFDKLAFEIFRDGEEIPVIYSIEVLTDFRLTKLSRVEQLLDETCARTFEALDIPPGADPRLGIIGPTIHNALKEDNQQIISQCVLWLAVRHPEIWGVEINREELTYLASDDRSSRHIN